MTLSPRVGGATSKPADTSPTPAGQRYASNSCVTTKMTYEFFNELIEIFTLAQAAYSVANVANDPNALKKILDSLRTGGFNFSVGIVNADSANIDAINAKTPSNGVGVSGLLMKSTSISSFSDLSIVLNSDNSESSNVFAVYDNTTDIANRRFYVADNGKVIIYGSGADELLQVIDNATTETLANPYMSFNYNTTVGGTKNMLARIGFTSNSDTNMTIENLATGGDIIINASSGMLDFSGDKLTNVGAINFGDDDLNHYEEGTFSASFYDGTTAVTGSNVSSYDARFTRIGNEVTVNISNIVWSVAGYCGTTLGSYPAITTAGECSIRGLPYNALKDASGSYIGFYNGSGDSNAGSAYIEHGTNSIRFSTTGFQASFGIRGVTIKYLV